MTRIFYKNLRPEYKYFLKDDYTSLSISRMVELGKKYESIKEDEKETKPTTRISEPKETDRLWKPPATQRMCWLCKKAGHLMNECPSSLTKTKTAIQAGPSCELKFDEEAEELSGSEVCPVEVIGELITAEESSTISDRRPYVPLILNNLKVSALVDTGATRSYVNQITAVEAVRGGAILNECNGYAIVADTRTVDITGSLISNVQIGNKILSLEFFILPKLTQNVLVGIDILEKIGIELSIRNPNKPRPGKAKKENSENTELNYTDFECYNLEEKLESTTPSTNQDLSSLSSKGLSRPTPEQYEIMQKFLDEQIPLLQSAPKHTHPVTHTVKIKPGTSPIRQKYYPLNPNMQKIADESLKEMLDKNVIRPSTSPWCSPVVLVKKKNGKYRFAIDFRKINEVSERDAYPMPQVEATLAKLNKARFLSTLDLKDGFWNVKLNKDSIPYTAFAVPGRGLFEFLVLPYGLHSASATFQKLQESEIIRPDMENSAFSYLDDIVVVSTSFEEHISVLRKISVSR